MRSLRGREQYWRGAQPVENGHLHHAEDGYEASVKSDQWLTQASIPPFLSPIANQGLAIVFLRIPMNQSLLGLELQEPPYPLFSFTHFINFYLVGVESIHRWEFVRP